MEASFRKFFPTKQKDLVASVITFVAFFVAAKIGFYIYFEYQTSPAVIWPPVGVAFIAIILGGYRVWFAIFLARLAVGLSESTAIEVSLYHATTSALQPVLGYYVLRQFGFRPQLHKISNTVLLILAALLVTLISPMLNTAFMQAQETLSVGPWFNIGRAWAAGIFSMIILVPFALTWYPLPKKILPEQTLKRVELTAAFLFLFAVNHFLFWTEYTQYVGISVIFFLPMVLIWFGLRFRLRWMTLAFLLTAIQGVAGTLLIHASDNPLSQQLLSVEIYIGLVAAIFLLFAAVVEERLQAYKRLQTAYQASSASDKAKTKFIAILAHELRNPLATVVSSLEFMDLNEADQHKQKLILTAKRHTYMMGRLLDDLLDTVRLTQGTFSLKKELVTLHEIISQSVESVQDFVTKNNHTIIRNEEISNSLQLSVDPLRMTQVVTNLLTNACKYTEPGGTITIATSVKDDEVLISITDTGVGIDADTAKHLYLPFYQDHPNPKRGTGLGIGLYITKQLVEMHGGRIEAIDRSDTSGSIFNVYLPISAVQKEISPVSTDTEADTEDLDTPTQVLVVDDNKMLADLLGKLLSKYKYSVKIVYSGAEALMAIKSYRPEYVLLDIGMPEMNGYQVARGMRDNGYNGTIVAVSGYSQEADQKEAFAAGFNHYLVKPVSASDIMDVLRRK